MLSINVYLKDDEVKKLNGFTTKMKQVGKPPQEHEEHRLSGLKLYNEKGRWHTPLDQPTDLIPAAVVDIVDEVSILEHISAYPKREGGIYRYESAEAELEVHNGYSTATNVKLHIRAKKLEDALFLLRQIKIGSIRPEESYEAQQGGMSRAELELDLEKAQSEVRRLYGVIGHLAEEADRLMEKCKHESQRRDMLTAFADALEEEYWPFCSKNKVAAKILAIIRDTNPDQK